MRITNRSPFVPDGKVHLKINASTEATIREDIARVNWGDIPHVERTDILGTWEFPEEYAEKFLELNPECRDMRKK